MVDFVKLLLVEAGVEVVLDPLLDLVVTQVMLGQDPVPGVEVALGEVATSNIYFRLPVVITVGVLALHKTYSELVPPVEQGAAELQVVQV
jgi:hypothetical protein